MIHFSPLNPAADPVRRPRARAAAIRHRPTLWSRIRKITKEIVMGLFAQDKQERAARRLYRRDPQAREELAALKADADANWPRDDHHRDLYLTREREIVRKYRPRP